MTLPPPNEVTALLGMHNLVKKAQADVVAATKALAPTLPVTVRSRPDLGADIVEYDVANPSGSPGAGRWFILYRGVAGIAPPYYFGNAFYAVYVSDIGGQGPAAYWLRSASPPPAGGSLPSSEGVQYPLGVLDTGSPEKLVCFVFYASAGSTVKILEGGIPDASKIVDLEAYVVNPSPRTKFCVTYSKQAALQYRAQTGYALTLLPPDPFNTSSVMVMPLATSYPTNEIIAGQYASIGECPPAE